MHAFPASFDLSCPQIDFAGLARSMGVASARVERPDEIAPAIDQALRHNGPFLIDLIIEGNPHTDANSLRCGQ